MQCRFTRGGQGANGQSEWSVEDVSSRGNCPGGAGDSYFRCGGLPDVIDSAEELDGIAHCPADSVPGEGYGGRRPGVADIAGDGECHG